MAASGLRYEPAVTFLIRTDQAIWVVSVLIQLQVVVFFFPLNCNMEIFHIK